MENKDLIQKAEDFLKDKELPEKIENFPSLIFQKASLIAKLEDKVNKAKDAAEIAKSKVENDLKSYEEKKVMGIKYKSGSTKEILEDTQEATKLNAEATSLNAEAIELTIEFEKQLATTAEFLFYLGCYNIATNESMIANLNEQLNKNEIESEGRKVKLSAKVKEQFREVVNRLIAQQDVLYRQEKFSKKLEELRGSFVKIEEKNKTLEESQEKFISQSKEQTSQALNALAKKREDDTMAIQNELRAFLDKTEGLINENLAKTEEKTNALVKSQEEFISQSKEHTSLALSEFQKEAKHKTAELQEQTDGFIENQNALFAKMKKQLTIYKVVSIIALAISIVSLLYNILF